MIVNTFGDLTAEIHSLLHNTTGIQEQLSYLTAPISASDTNLAIHDPDRISRGIIEIDSELLYVDIVNGDSLTVPPFGRGYRGSVAATHAINAPVVHRPVFPKLNIQNAINECLRYAYPAIFQVKTTTFTFNGAVLTYDLPSDCDEILNVTWQTIGPSGYWETAYGWRFEPKSQTAGGKSITLLDLPSQGRTVQVVYKAKFGELTLDSDTLAGAGIDQHYVDLITYAVASKLLRFADFARLQLDSLENVSRAQVVAPGDAGKIANQMYAMYQQRLSEERSRLLNLYPPQLRFTR